MVMEFRGQFTYLAGAELSELFPELGRISINFTACRKMLPDPEFYQQCLQVAGMNSGVLISWAVAGVESTPRNRTFA
jgi:hypothetical protein